MFPHFGIITPTRKRHRFLRNVLRQTLNQTHARWTFILVSDGPDANARRLFHRHSKGDARMLYRETPRPARDWGYTPRCLGLDVLAGLFPAPDYVVFWDDDNAFLPDALERVARELERHARPDLLLVPVRSRLTQIPEPGFEPDRAQGSCVDTANLVVRLPVAVRHLPGDEQAGERGFDVRFFNRMRADQGNRIAYSGATLIGRYDGLRPLATLRWRLGIPPAGLADQRWYAPIRRLFRG